MSDAGTIEVRVNERLLAVDAGTTLFALRDRVKPGADVLVRNGFPCAADVALAPGDDVVLIRRGEVPGEDELEALMVARHGPGVHARVKRATVGIAGCGGLGSAVAIALARTGVGRLRIVDFDVVEPSNLNRQQFFVDQLGLPKVDALAANLARINPYVRVEPIAVRLTEANVPEVFAGCDALAECFDDPAMKRAMAQAVRTRMKDVPLVTVSGIAGVGPGNAIRVQRVLPGVFLVGDAVTAAAPGCGLLAPRVGIAASQQANAILRLLLGEDPVEDQAR